MLPKVLVVGAGGIGCELLKCLVLSGFHDLTVVDLDTIDVSNLNRQFLFRRAHVGKPKAEVARDSVLRFCPQASITALRGNIKDPDLGNEFFQQFGLVMNALDNLDARRYVNRMCLLHKLPLVESGTGGYAGQVKVIHGGKTECFECGGAQTAGSTQKTYPVCTIRNTPDLPVHCVAWAKYLFSSCFGPQDSSDHNIMSDVKLPDIKDSTDHRTKGKMIAEALFEQLFNGDIIKAREVTDRWVHRAPPVPVEFKKLLAGKKVSKQIDSQTVGSLEQYVNLFFDSFDRLWNDRKDDIGALVFDKDDDLLVDFITALANVRMHVFHIPLQSKFDVKGIAGNIIHAIATTNAIAAGLMVIQALKVVNGKLSECKHSWIGRSGPRPITSEELGPPRSTCFVCSAAIVNLSVDTSKVTLREFYQKILTKSLSLNNPSIDIPSKGTSGYIGWEEDHEDDELLDKVIGDDSVGIKNDSVLEVSDDSNGFNIRVFIRHFDFVPEEDETKIEKQPFFISESNISEKPSKPRSLSPVKSASPVRSKTSPVRQVSTASKDSGGGVIVLDDDEEAENTNLLVSPKLSSKRKVDTEVSELDEDSTNHKKRKV